MKTTVVAIVLFATLVLACGKDDDTSATGSSVASSPQDVGTRMEIESVSGTVDRNVTADITMHMAKAGVAGFTLEVSIADPTIARIVGLDLSNFGLSETSPLPTDVLSISAVDLSRSFEGPFERETMATLEFELLSPGDTEIVLRISKLDDDDGDAVFVEAVNGKLSVVDTGARP